MKIDILTLFPEMFTGFLTTSMVKRAIAKGAITIETHDIRSYTTDKYGRVDDYPIGGGAGLVMKCQPIVDALKALRTSTSHVILMSPTGPTFTQTKAQLLVTTYDHLILICGHYEGVDARIDNYIDETISIGDYILTGGELAAMVITDAVMRLREGAITNASLHEESFNEYLLEYPQYSLPRDFDGHEVPDILFSGNHSAIAKWRRKQQLRLTKQRRPYLFAHHHLTKQDTKLLQEEGVTAWEVKAIDQAKKFMK
jgi:tRNA (guanine37-N1)-methyltransferase